MDHLHRSLLPYRLRHIHIPLCYYEHLVLTNTKICLIAISHFYDEIQRLYGTGGMRMDLK